MARIKGRYDVKVGNDGKTTVVKGKRRMSASQHAARGKSKKQTWRAVR